MLKCIIIIIIIIYRYVQNWGSKESDLSTAWWFAYYYTMEFPVGGPLFPGNPDHLSGE